jgi:quercetin dioxygenase-like cupin family protein
MEMTDPEDLFAGAQGAPEPTGSSFRSLDLKSELHSLRAEDHAWQAGRNAKILVKYPDFRILLVALHRGTHVAEHRAPGAISVQTISGPVLIRAAGRVFDLPEGQMLTLEREIPHDLEALAESAVLVTIVWPKIKS